MVNFSWAQLYTIGYVLQKYPTMKGISINELYLDLYQYTVHVFNLHITHWVGIKKLEKLDYIKNFQF